MTATTITYSAFKNIVKSTLNIKGCGNFVRETTRGSRVVLNESYSHSWDSGFRKYEYILWNPETGFRRIWSPEMYSQNGEASYNYDYDPYTQTPADLEHLQSGFVVNLKQGEFLLEFYSSHPSNDPWGDEETEAWIEVYQA